MNAQRARELFSAYLEGTLEPGLRQALERRLTDDASLMAEYQEFQRICASLSALAHRPVEIPEDLAERIQVRLDREFWEAARRPRPALSAWWASVALGGVAVFAILGGVISLGITSGTDRAAAGTLALPTAGAQPLLRAESSGYVLDHPPISSRHLIVRAGVSGPIVKEFRLTNGALRSPIRNVENTAVLMTVESPTGRVWLQAAIPGRRPERSRTGEGTVVDAALAAADYFDRAVVLEGFDAASLTSRTRWRLPDSSSPENAVEAQFTDEGLSLEQGSPRLLILRRRG